MQVLDQRWSFGGADSAVTSGDGTFLPGWLLVSSQKAVADGWWRPSGEQHRTLPVPLLTDVAAVDDRGGTYILQPTGMSSGTDHPDREAWPQTLEVQLDPPPARGTGWIEFRGRDGTTARLLPSPRSAARVSPLTPVAASQAERELLRHAQSLLAWTQSSSADAEMMAPRVRRSRAEILRQAASMLQSGELDPASPVPGQIAALCDALLDRRVTGGLPAGWAGMLTAAGRRDGRVLHLDLGVTLPTVQGMTLRLDTLISAADSWRLCWQATPGWYVYGEPGEDGRREAREVFSVSAEDDRGGAYISAQRLNRPISRRGRETRDHDEHCLSFRPRLDPLAGTVRLTFRGTDQEAQVTISLR